MTMENNSKKHELHSVDGGKASAEQENKGEEILTYIRQYAVVFVCEVKEKVNVYLQRKVTELLFFSLLFTLALVSVVFISFGIVHLSQHYFSLSIGSSYFFCGVFFLFAAFVLLNIFFLKKRYSSFRSAKKEYVRLEKNLKSDV